GRLREDRKNFQRKTALDGLQPDPDRSEGPYRVSPPSAGLYDEDRVKEMMNAIQTDQLTRSFGTLKAVDRLTIEVPRGTVFGFLGPNGSGKTTTIRLLLGLLEPDQGSAQVMGFDSRKQAGEVRTRCGALLEHHGLYERLSAAENLDYYGRIWHMSKTDRENRIRELLEPLDLYDRRSEPIGRWS